MGLVKFSKIRGPGLRTPCGEGWRRLAAGTGLHQNLLDRLGSLSYAELGLLQAGGATDEASDFGQ